MKLLKFHIYSYPLLEEWLQAALIPGNSGRLGRCQREEGVQKVSKCGLGCYFRESSRELFKGLGIFLGILFDVFLGVHQCSLLDLLRQCTFLPLPNHCHEPVNFAFMESPYGDRLGFVVILWGELTGPMRSRYWKVGPCISAIEWWHRMDEGTPSPWKQTFCSFHSHSVARWENLSKGFLEFARENK